METHIDEILDYVRCPMLHHFRYIEKQDVTYQGGKRTYLKLNEFTVEELFNREIHRLAYHIFNMIQDGRYPSEYLLRQKWGKIWSSEKTKEDIMFASNTARGQSSLRRFEKEGIKAIEIMHPKFKANPGFPIFVGKNTVIEIREHRITVPLELVREIDHEGEKIIEIMDLKTGIRSKNKFEHKPLSLHINHDLKTTAASLAFRQLTGEKEGCITYYDILNDKEYVTKRSETDYKTLEKVIDNVEKAMDNGVLYPVMNERCFECPYQYECKKREWYT